MTITYDTHYKALPLLETDLGAVEEHLAAPLVGLSQASLQSNGSGVGPFADRQVNDGQRVCEILCDERSCSRDRQATGPCARELDPTLQIDQEGQVVAHVLRGRGDRRDLFAPGHFVEFLM